MPKGVGYPGTRRGMPKPHKGMGFKAAVASAAAGGAKNPAGAIAAAARKASPAAKRANPNLKKVLMPKKGK